MTVACGMIGCPDWVSILGLRPIMREVWTTKERTGTGDDEVCFEWSNDLYIVKAKKVW